MALTSWTNIFNAQLNNLFRVWLVFKIVFLQSIIRIKARARFCLCGAIGVGFGYFIQLQHDKPPHNPSALLAYQQAPPRLFRLDTLAVLVAQSIRAALQLRIIAECSLCSPQCRYGAASRCQSVITLRLPLASCAYTMSSIAHLNAQRSSACATD